MLKILFNIIKKNKGAVIALALLTFVSAATSLITPYLSGTFIDILSGQEGTLSVEKCKRKRELERELELEHVNCGMCGGSNRLSPHPFYLSISMVFFGRLFAGAMFITIFPQGYCATFHAFAFWRIFQYF